MRVDELDVAARYVFQLFTLSRYDMAASALNDAITAITPSGTYGQLWDVITRGFEEAGAGGTVLNHSYLTLGRLQLA
jgi:hypothetical protein